MKQKRLQRTDISLSQRVMIAVDLIVNYRYHGKIIDIAKQLSVSRQTIYGFIAAVLLNLKNLLGVCSKPLFRKGTDEELIVTAQLLGETLSQDGVREMANRLTGCNRSPNFYTGFTRMAGEVAGEMLRETARKADHAALDETFPNNTMLTAAHPFSLATLGVRLLDDTPLTQEAWMDFLETELPNIGYPVCDGGRSLLAALTTLGITHDPDYTHASCPVGLARFRARKLTARAFGKLENAEKTYRKAEREKRQQLLFPELDRFDDIRLEYEAALVKAERMMDAWTAADMARRFVKEAFRYTRGTRVATVADARYSLTKAIELLAAHGDTVPEMGKAASYLRGIMPMLGGFLNRLASGLDKLGDGAREGFVVVRRERQGHTQEARGSAWDALFETGLDDDTLMALLLRIDEAYDRLLGTVARSSSSVEHLHSRLAPYVAVSDRLSQWRWNLVALRLNGTSFKEGKRAGKSPYDLLDAPLGGHWSEVLIGRLRERFPASVDYLLACGTLPSGWSPAMESSLAASGLEESVSRAA